MIVSRKYEFIYLKTLKTAGTSVELAISPYCGAEDILAPINPYFEIERAKKGMVARNFSRDPSLEAQLQEAADKKAGKIIKALIAKNAMTGGCTSHMTAQKVKAWVGEGFWNSAFKFATIRHPYEAAVSLAYFRHRGSMDDLQGLTSHLDKIIEDGEFLLSKILLLDGKLAADHYIRFDHFEEDLRSVTKRLAMPDLGILPRARDHQQPNRGQAAQFLSPDQKRRIQKSAALEFDQFGWEP